MEDESVMYIEYNCVMYLGKPAGTVLQLSTPLPTSLLPLLFPSPPLPSPLPSTPLPSSASLQQVTAVTPVDSNDRVLLSQLYDSLSQLREKERATGRTMEILQGENSSLQQVRHVDECVCVGGECA